MAELKYIIGLGVGRSGTTSLAALLNAQAGACCTHERCPYLPWEARPDHVRRALDWLERGGVCKGSKRRETVGDVSYAWLPALPAARERFGERLTVVAIRRGRLCTAQSWMASDKHDESVIHHGRTKSARQFPTLKGETRDAWLRYHANYYGHIPGEEQVAMHWLASEEGQDRILQKAGIPEAQRVYGTFHRNARAHSEK